MFQFWLDENGMKFGFFLVLFCFFHKNKSIYGIGFSYYNCWICAFDAAAAGDAAAHSTISIFVKIISA